jgi:two-component system phosphate regulon sensor histidine kinase PhoR
MHDPEKSRRFLEILSKQADRLNNIFEDLLTLSRIEQESERHHIEMAQGRLKDALEEAIELCQVQAEDNRIAVRLQCRPELRARFNPDLLQQALVNLITNAVKYSDPGQEVEVSAEETPTGVSIKVTDHGTGIPSDHLPRIFERFYRVDKARSAETGGTGLGLSIVKHIAQVHGGEINVDSKPGKGSVFTLTLPET